MLSREVRPLAAGGGGNGSCGVEELLTAPSQAARAPTCRLPHSRSMSRTDWSTPDVQASLRASVISGAHEMEMQARRWRESTRCWCICST